MSMAMSAEASGTMRMQITMTTSAKISFSSRETLRSDFMRILRSAGVVSQRMIGGWMSGTSDM